MDRLMASWATNRWLYFKKHVASLQAAITKLQNAPSVMPRPLVITSIMWPEILEGIDGGFSKAFPYLKKKKKKETKVCHLPVFECKQVRMWLMWGSLAAMLWPQGDKTKDQPICSGFSRKTEGTWVLGDLGELLDLIWNFQAFWCVNNNFLFETFWLNILLLSQGSIRGYTKELSSQCEIPKSLRWMKKTVKGWMWPFLRP